VYIVIDCFCTGAVLRLRGRYAAACGRPYGRLYVQSVLVIPARQTLARLSAYDLLASSVNSKSVALVLLPILSAV